MLTRMAPLLTRMARMARMLTRMTRWLAGSHIIHTLFQIATQRPAICIYYNIQSGSSGSVNYY